MVLEHIIVQELWGYENDVYVLIKQPKNPSDLPCLKRLVTCNVMPTTLLDRHGANVHLYTPHIFDCAPILAQIVQERGVQLLIRLTSAANLGLYPQFRCNRTPALLKQRGGLTFLLLGFVPFPTSVHSNTGLHTGGGIRLYLFFGHCVLFLDRRLVALWRLQRRAPHWHNRHQCALWFCNFCAKSTRRAIAERTCPH
jgi:hypothetical protein